MLERALAAAERHIEVALRNLDKQRRMVAELDRDGHDATTAREVLATFEDTLCLHEAGRQRILQEMGR